MHFEGTDSDARLLEAFNIEGFRLEGLQVDTTGAGAR